MLRKLQIVNQLAVSTEIPSMTEQEISKYNTHFNPLIWTVTACLIYHLTSQTHNIKNKIVQISRPKLTSRLATSNQKEILI